MPVVVHGIVTADAGVDVDDLTASARTPVRLVGHRDVAGLLTEVSEPEVLPSRAHLLTHTGVLEAACVTTTVLPVRFGTVADDPDTLVEHVLAPRHDALRAALDRLAGCVELRLKASYDERTTVGAVIAADPRAARLRGRPGLEARIELGQRVADGIAARRERDLARIADALDPHVEDVVVSGVADPLDAFAVSFLVAGAMRGGFEAAVDDLAAAFGDGLEVELIGPLPPFSFAAGVS